MAAYYQDKVASLADIFGAPSVVLEEDRIRVGTCTYPIVDDVIVVLDPARYPPRLRQRLGNFGGSPAAAGPFSESIQHTFGAEWQAFPDVLREHEAEFRQYFDLVDLEDLEQARVADLGCGAGRWGYFLKSLCRELVLVDFSEAIFVARLNLRDCPSAIFVMGDITQLPFRKDFADLVVCLGVLHHLPVRALDVVRRLGDLAPRALVYLYYALDNRAAHYRVLLRAVTAARMLTCRVRSPRARAAISWAGTAGLYVPLVVAGSLLTRLGMGGLLPLHDTYRGKSFGRMRQDVYDRFFTRIEQRFSRDQVLELRDTFSEVRVSAGLPYWHFLCLRADARTLPAAAGVASSASR
jgi:SAM-dependent methyltransferase